jgi:hypothetical protein
MACLAAGRSRPSRSSTRLPEDKGLGGDAVMSKHPTKALSLYLNEQTKTLGEFMDEKMDGIPLFRGLKVTGSAFFSHPLIPEFLHIYGSQIHTVIRSKKVSVDNDVVPEEVAFYQTAQPDPVANVPDGKLPALERLQILTVRSSF